MQPSQQSNVLYQPDESPPNSLSLGLSLQHLALLVTGIVFVPALVAKASGASQGYHAWALFAAFATAGLSTLLQVKRIGLLGCGYNIAMGGSAAFIAISILTISESGPAMLATLVLISALVPIVLSIKLFLLRRILTPTISGTLVMLIPASVMPVVFDMLQRVPEGHSPLEPFTCAE